MSSPFEELILQLMALREELDYPRDHMDTVARADPLLPGTHGAKNHADQILGRIPLPQNHPKWEAIAGAIAAAIGAIDEVIYLEQEIKQKAMDAVASWQQAQAEIDAAIQGFQQ